MSTLAYYDSLTHLIPCVALARDPVTGEITIRIIAPRGGYARGEVLHTSALWVIPRTHCHKSRRGPFHFYNWDDLLASPGAH